MIKLEGFSIKDFRELLDRYESEWTMDEYMGKFEDQPLMTPIYESTDGSIVYRGIGHVTAVEPAWEFGLVLSGDLG